MMCILVCLLVFRILMNVKNLKNPFCFSPFGQHLSGFVKQHSHALGFFWAFRDTPRPGHLLHAAL